MKYSFTSREIQSILHNGFLSIFKPKDISLEALIKNLIKNICLQANELDIMPIPTIEMPIVEPHPVTMPTAREKTALLHLTVSGALMVIGMRKQLDYRHPLMVGKLFQPEDILVEPLQYLEASSSGVCLLGINDGCDQLKKIRERAWLNEYYIEGELGHEKANHDINGKLVAKAKYDHVTTHKMSKVLSKINMQFKRESLSFINADIQSQEAFELARKGTPRPRVLGTQIVYNVELKNFHTPYFTINVQSVCDDDRLLRQFVYEIGCHLDTLACTRRLRRIRQGCFGLEHAILDKHFHLETILKNILVCNRIVKTAMDNDQDIVQTQSKEVTAQGKILLDRYRLRYDPELLPEDEDCLRLPWSRNYHIIK